MKIVVYVPLTHTTIVRNAIGDAGAGNIGNYSHCSFSSKGTGRFFLKRSQSNIGKVGKAEEVEEERIETICPRQMAKEVIAAIKNVHPYEEVALDIYPLINEESL